MKSKNHLIAITLIIFISLAVAAWAQLPSTIDLNVAPGTESTDVTRVYGDDSGDILGSGLSHGIAFGDVNGDGIDDVIIGADSADPPGGGRAGEVVVVYGSTSLPTSTEIDLDTTPGAHGETRILGDDFADQAGLAVASGDVDGDGFRRLDYRGHSCRSPRACVSG